MITRRKLIKGSAAIMGLSMLHNFQHLLAADTKRNFYIGACDWSLGKTSDLKSLEVAKTIGLDGVQVSPGTLENNMHLFRKEVQKQYLSEARTQGVQVGGLGLGILNKVPYASDPRAEEWVSKTIDAAKAMEVKVILVAFFEEGDIKNDKKGQQEVIKKFKKVAPKAEKAGVILGIESWLSAKEHMNIIDEVGSPNLQVYYDVANSHKMGYNIYDEIRWLGKNICEFHAKENGNLLGKGAIDFKEVRKAMDEIGFQGWVQIEGSVPPQKELVESYKANNQFLRRILNV
jgi:L-ribulose-5-phosphate 3-epimerase